MRARTPGARAEEPPPGPGGGEERSAHRAAAFGAIVCAHCDRLVRYVYRFLRSREAAEDIVHEVFIRLWERGEEQTLTAAAGMGHRARPRMHTDPIKKRPKLVTPYSPLRRFALSAVED